MLIRWGTLFVLDLGLHSVGQLYLQGEYLDEYLHIAIDKSRPDHVVVRESTTVVELLNIKHMTLKELLDELHLPNVLNTDMMFHYKQFYEKCANDCCRLLPFPTGACTLRFAKDLFKREPLFTAVFSDDSPFFVHLTFAGFEKDLIEFGLQTEEHLDMEVFKKCVDTLDVNDPTAAREAFRAFSNILPTRTANEPHIWYELPFIPCCTVDTVRKRERSRVGNSCGSDLLGCHRTTHQAGEARVRGRCMESAGLF